MLHFIKSGTFEMFKLAGKTVIMTKIPAKGWFPLGEYGEYDEYNEKRKRRKKRIRWWIRWRFAEYAKSPEHSHYKTELSPNSPICKVYLLNVKCLVNLQVVVAFLWKDLEVMACWRRHRLFICLSLALIRCKAKQRRLQMSLKKRKRRFWVRKIFRRKHKSEYYNLVQELRLDDREYHFRYMWMSKERFDHLFSLLEEHLTKHTTKFRKPVPARERLVITLRYLASGMSQQDLSYSFREGRATICNIIKETL